MENDEKRANRMLALFWLILMLGIVGFMMWKNQKAENENVVEPTPTVEITTEPQE